MKWEPIATAPKDGTKVLLLTDDGIAVEAFWDASFVQGWNYNYMAELVDDLGACTYEVVNATHWAPLPEPPVATAEKEQAEGGGK